MLLDASDHSLAQPSGSLLEQLSAGLSAHTSPETHASVIELRTGIHSDAREAVAELSGLRTQMAAELRAMGLLAASAGTYPLTRPGETRVSDAGRYRVVADSMRSLARREPTLALHVHVGVRDPEEAIRLLNGLRGAVPLLLALSGNSPFSHCRDSGFASARTVVFGAFPRTGTARPFSSYADYVYAVDALIASGAIPDPSFLWWDVRLQPSLGTVEVRVMDAQCTVGESAALVALVRALARLAVEHHLAEVPIAPEVLAENRFLAARDGLDARLIDPVQRRLMPVRALIAALLARCREHADVAGQVEFDELDRMVVANGADHQRRWAHKDGLAALPRTLTQLYPPSGGGLARVAEPVPTYEGAFC